MASATLTFIFGNIGYLLTGLYILVAIACVLSRDSEDIATAAMLGFICIAAWIPSLWYSPLNMSLIHVGILVAMLVSLRGTLAPTLIGLVFIALVADTVWVMMPGFDLPANELHFPYSIFWWQCVMNILFLLLCFGTLVRCYNNHKSEGSFRNVRFYARSAAVDRGPDP